MKNRFLFLFFTVFLFSCNKNEKRFLVNDMREIQNVKNSIEEIKEDSTALVKEWIIKNYDFNSTPSFNKEKYTKSYIEYIKDGLSLVYSDDDKGITEEQFKDKWKEIYTIDDASYDREGFDPGITKITKCIFKKKLKNGYFFEVTVEDLGYDENNLEHKNKFYKTIVKVVSAKQTFLIDEILYEE